MVSILYIYIYIYILYILYIHIYIYTGGQQNIYHQYSRGQNYNYSEY